MIKLSFVLGHSLRRVNINNREISFATQETGFVPLKLNLDKLEDFKEYDKLNDEEKKLLEECKKLKTEEDMAYDLIKDFKKGGWKLIK